MQAFEGRKYPTPQTPNPKLRALKSERTTPFGLSACVSDAEKKMWSTGF
jgi:hypothetical protein